MQIKMPSWLLVQMAFSAGQAIAVQPPSDFGLVEIKSQCDDLSGVYSYSADAYSGNPERTVISSLDQVTYTNIWKYPDLEEYPEEVEIKHIDAEHVIIFEGRSRHNILSDRKSSYLCANGWVVLSQDLGNIGAEGVMVTGSRVSYMHKSINGDLLVQFRTNERHCSFFGLSCKNIGGEYWFKYRTIRVKGDGGNKK